MGAAGKQRRIDFEHCGRANQIAALRLPERVLDGGQPIPTSGRMMAAALKEIDSMVGQKDAFKVTQAAIAARLNAEQSTVKRALRALRVLGLIDVQRTGRGSWYQISWERVRQWLADQSANRPDSAVAMGQPAPSRRVDTLSSSTEEDLTSASTGEAAHGSAAAAGGCADEEEAAWQRHHRWLASQTPPLYDLAGTFAFARQTYSACQFEALRERFEANRHKADKPTNCLVTLIRVGRLPFDEVDPRAIREARESEEERQRQAQQQAAEDARRDADHRKKLAALEAAYGAEIDALDGDGLRELAAASLPNDFARSCFVRSPRGGFRYDVLVAIHAHRLAATQRSADREDCGPEPVGVTCRPQLAALAVA